MADNHPHAFTSTVGVNVELPQASFPGVGLSHISPFKKFVNKSAGHVSVATSFFLLGCMLPEVGEVAEILRIEIGKTKNIE